MSPSPKPHSKQPQRWVEVCGESYGLCLQAMGMTAARKLPAGKYNRHRSVAVVHRYFVFFPGSNAARFEEYEVLVLFQVSRVSILASNPDWRESAER